jgi:hypothetical protein
MRIIIKVIDRSKRMSEAGKEYSVTTAQLDDGSIVEGYGINYVVGDEVESFYHEKYDKHKMQKGKR